MRSPLSALAALLALGALLGFVACGGDARVDQTRANATVKALADELGAATSVECPAGVKPVIGASFECEATFASGGRHAAVVTIDYVDGSNVQMTARWRQPLLGAKQREAVSASMAAKLGVTATIHCDHDVIAVAADERIRCIARGVAGNVQVDLWLDADGSGGWELVPDAPAVPAAVPPAPAPPPDRGVEIPAEVTD